MFEESVQQKWLNNFSPWMAFHKNKLVTIGKLFDDVKYWGDGGNQEERKESREHPLDHCKRGATTLSNNVSLDPYSSTYSYIKYYYDYQLLLM